MYKHLKTTLFLLLVGSMAKAQLLTPQTISTAGVSSSNGGVLLEYSIGGTLVSTISTPTFVYTQGFLQPDAGTTTTPPHINDVALSSGSGFNNAGTTFINGNTMLEFTLGEVASTTLNSPNNMLTQGILQPYKICVPLLVLNSNSFLSGSYEAQTEIRLEGNFSVFNGSSLFLNAPKVTVVNNMQIQAQAQVLVSKTGCQ